MALLVATLSVSCCAFGRVQRLDVALNLKSMQLYYPENQRTAESRNSTIDLKKLFQCISCLKNICILSFVMLLSFGDVGLLSMVFYNESESSSTNAVMYFQHQGLTNTHGVAYNSYIDALEEMNGDENLLITTAAPIEVWPYIHFTLHSLLRILIHLLIVLLLLCHQFLDSTVILVHCFFDQDYSESFQSMATLWRGWIAVIFVLNLFVFLPFVCCVVLKYRSIGCCKFSVVLFSFVEWLVFTILMGLYFYEFHVFFNNHAEDSLLFELDQTAELSSFVIAWFPDWGIFIALLLWFYLIKLMLSAFKAM